MCSLQSNQFVLVHIVLKSFTESVDADIEHKKHSFSHKTPKRSTPNQRFNKKLNANCRKLNPLFILVYFAMNFSLSLSASKTLGGSLYVLRFLHFSALN